MLGSRFAPYAILFASCLSPCFAVANATAVKVEVRDSVIYLEANSAPLADVLKALSDKTGLVIKSSDELSEIVSYNIEGESLQGAVKRLMKNRSYMLVRKGDGKGKDEFVSAELRVLGGDPSVCIQPQSDQGAGKNAQPVDQRSSSDAPRTKQYEKGWFLQQFGSPEAASKLVAAQSASDEPHPKGFVIASLDEKSIFGQIGLDAGDTVLDVNGRPIETVGEFVEAIQSLPQGQGVIRINRLKNDRVDPVYIELQ